MKINAEQGESIWSGKNDSRITKVGKIIRMLRLDELPQLISVLKGEMSLIGPRPERQDIDEKLVKNITSKGFVRSNYKKKLVDLSDIKINLKGKK